MSEAGQGPVRGKVPATVGRRRKERRPGRRLARPVPGGVQTPIPALATGRGGGARRARWLFCRLRSYARAVARRSRLRSPSGVAVLLAVFLSFWTWVYTYRRDSWKFWIGLVLNFVGVMTVIFFVGLVILFGVWLWARPSSPSLVPAVPEPRVSGRSRLPTVAAAPTWASSGRTPQNLPVAIRAIGAADGSEGSLHYREERDGDSDEVKGRDTDAEAPCRAHRARSCRCRQNIPAPRTRSDRATAVGRRQALGRAGRGERRAPAPALGDPPRLTIAGRPDVSTTSSGPGRCHG